MDGSPLSCRVRIPSAGINHTVFSGWTRVIMLYDQTRLLSPSYPSSRQAEVINMDSV